MQNMPTANRVARHHGNDRFGARSDLTLKIKDIEAMNPLRISVARFPPNALVPPGTKGLVPGSSEDDHTDLRILMSKVQGLE